MGNVIYTEGQPRQYRFNGQTGRFNIDGEKDMGSKISFIPLVWRIFNETLFGRKQKDKWVEIFFIDEENHLSAIIFNNTSVNALLELVEPLFYEQLSLSDVNLMVQSEKKLITKKFPIGEYYVARFNYLPASQELVRERREWIKQNKIYREETLLPTSEHDAVSKGFYNKLLETSISFTFSSATP